MSRSVLAVLALSALSSPALAQDDAGAGLFHEARQLPLVSQSMTLEVAGGEATLHLVQVFTNGGSQINQADYHLYLPDEAVVSGYGFWKEGRFLQAKLQEKDQAKAAHASAVTEGRSSTIMHREGQIHSFSVSPVEAGALAQVETTIRLPIAMELGRSHIKLPVDEFLGQAGPGTSLTVRLASDEPLSGFGVTGQDSLTLSKTAREASFAWSGDEAIDVWWQEEVPPLLVRADVTDAGEGKDAVRLRVVLDDAQAEVSYEKVHVLIDGSFSMRRRSAAVETMANRLAQRSTVPVTFHVVGADRTGVSASKAVAQLLDGSAGHSAKWSDFDELATSLGCGGAVKCLALGDAQLAGLAASEQSGLPVVLMADPHERSYFEASVPKGTVWIDPDTDAEAKMLAAIDRLVVPTLEFSHLEEQGGEPVRFTDGQLSAVAEGGMMRMFGLGDPGQLVNGDRVVMYATIDGELIERTVEVRRVVGSSDEGEAVRRGAWRAELAQMMRAYKDSPDQELKKRITAISLREDIPTAFTSLQVADPELSLAAIKGGDPILTVFAEPGLTDVVAWYPFGDARRLVAEAGEDRFTDSFLAPRYWDEKAYRVDVFKHFADGSTTQEAAWYVIDEAKPTARLVTDAEAGVLRVEGLIEAAAIGSVHVHTEDEVVQLEADESGSTWTAPLAALPKEFAVIVRDRAGNRTRFEATLKKGALTVHSDRRERAATAVLPQRDAVLVGGGQLSLDGDMATLRHGPGWTFDASALELRSLIVTSVADVDGDLFVGTRGGDLFRLVARAGAPALAESIATGHAEHPVTGIVELSEGTVLVGILGSGLFEVEGGHLVKNDKRINSAYVTGLAATDDGEALVATGYGGLWRVSETRSKRTRFPHKNVLGFERTGGELVVRSGAGRYRYDSDRRFERLDAGLNHYDVGADDLVAATLFAGQMWVAGLDSGMHRMGDSGAESVGLDLSPGEGRINDVEVFDGRIYLATEAGLLSVGPAMDSASVQRHSDAATHSLDVSEFGLAVASKKGVWVLRPGGEQLRVDAHANGDLLLDGSTGSYSSVAWHSGALYAGGMEGLYRFDWFSAKQVTDGFGSHWVTALQSDGDSLYVGTYASGVFEVDGSTADEVEQLAGQWVPPNGLSVVNDELWVGGIGMAPVVLTDGGAERVPVPVRDVSSVVANGDQVLMVTSDGVFELGLIMAAPAHEVRRGDPSGRKLPSPHGEGRDALAPGEGRDALAPGVAGLDADLPAR